MRTKTPVYIVRTTQGTLLKKKNEVISPAVISQSFIFEKMAKIELMFHNLWREKKTEEERMRFDFRYCKYFRNIQRGSLLILLNEESKFDKIVFLNKIVYGHRVEKDFMYAAFALEFKPVENLKVQEKMIDGSFIGPPVICFESFISQKKNSGTDCHEFEKIVEEAFESTSSSFEGALKPVYNLCERNLLPLVKKGASLLFANCVDLFSCILYVLVALYKYFKSKND
jgi:hypothetical protein